MAELIMSQVPGWPDETRMYQIDSKYYLVNVPSGGLVRKIVNSVARDVPEEDLPPELKVVTQVSIFLAEHDEETMGAPLVIDADGDAINGLTPYATLGAGTSFDDAVAWIGQHVDV